VKQKAQNEKEQTSKRVEHGLSPKQKCWSTENHACFTQLGDDERGGNQ
jgi:hypothetical protein